MQSAKREMHGGGYIPRGDERRFPSQGAPERPTRDVNKSGNYANLGVTSFSSSSFKNNETSSHKKDTHGGGFIPASGR
jgi:hypothetical protein